MKSELKMNTCPITFKAIAQAESSAFLRDLQDFAAAMGTVVRFGPQKAKPISAASPGRAIEPAPARVPKDPFVEYSDDYTYWCQNR